MTVTQSVSQLQRFVRELVSARIKSKEGWRVWRKDPQNERFMADCFAYTRGDGMPAITALVQPFFHPSLPLIGLNYTQVAHNTLHAFPGGWTVSLRLCRGIVFNRRGTVVAFPFPKFFNYGEQPETKNLPDEPFVATVKEDGHLGIIFEYRGQILVTTRGCFDSSSSQLADMMLQDYRDKWADTFPKNVTVCAEIIHPDTEVHVDYGGRKGFVLIGAFDRRTFQDFDYQALSRLSASLGLPVTELWSGSSIEELRSLMKDLSVRNREGFVVRFQSGLRVKFKFASYVALMIGSKLTYRYVMKHLAEGTLDRKIADLPAEVQIEARRLADDLLAVQYVPGDKKAKWEYLYSLVPEAERSDYHRSVCRQFYAWIVRTGASSQGGSGL